MARVSLAASYARVCSGTCPGENTVLQMSGARGEETGGGVECGLVSVRALAAHYDAPSQRYFYIYITYVSKLILSMKNNARGLTCRRTPVKMRHTQHMAPQMAPAIIPAISTVSSAIIHFLGRVSGHTQFAP